MMPALLDLTVDGLAGRLKTHLPTDRVPTFDDVLEALRKESYNGSIILHLQNGYPRQLDVGRPVMVALEPATGKKRATRG